MKESLTFYNLDSKGKYICGGPEILPCLKGAVRTSGEERAVKIQWSLQRSGISVLKCAPRLSVPLPIVLWCFRYQNFVL